MYSRNEEMVNLLNRVLHYSSILLIGGLTSQGLSFVVRLIMIRDLLPKEYGKFVLVWSAYSILLIFSHLDLHSPIAHILGGKRPIDNSDEKVESAATINLSIKITKISSIIPTCIIITFTIFVGYNWKIALVTGFSMYFYSVFVNLLAIARGLGDIYKASISYSLIGITRLIGAIYLYNNSYSLNDYTINYLYPQIPLTFFLYYWLKLSQFKMEAPIEIKDGITLITKGFYVIVSDVSTSGLYFTLILYSGFRLGHEQLPLLDIIITALALLSIITSNIGLSLIIVGNEIKDVKKIKKAILGKLLPVLLITGILASIVIVQLKVNQLISNFLKLNVTMSFQFILLLTLITIFQSLSVISSGLAQGKGKFKLVGRSKAISLIIVCISLIVILPSTIYSVSLILASYFILNNILIYYKL